MCLPNLTKWGQLNVIISDPYDVQVTAYILRPAVKREIFRED